jgi:hypothetical protein
MSTWGSGNFENDGALDILGANLAAHVAAIRQAFDYVSHVTLYDNQGDSEIIARVDIRATLSEHYKTAPEIEPEEISRWKQNYLETFDRLAASPTPVELYPDYINRRRAVINSTFDRLHNAVVSFLES